jgi:hypothetical protein
MKHQGTIINTKPIFPSTFQRTVKKEKFIAELSRNVHPNRGGLVSKSLCGISYKKFFKIPQRPLFGTFCMGDYKSLAAIAAFPQWPVRLCTRMCY